MIATEKELLEFLESHQFQYRYVAHEAVFTCAEAEQKRPDLPGVSTKNLFLCDKKERRFFLVTTACEKQMDLAMLAEQLGVRKLRFASEENLKRMLGVTRGAVTMLGLVNDIEHAVELWVDSQMWGSDTFLCHPLVNTATLVLSKKSLEHFFALTGHTVRLFEAKSS
jgi:Ala-tRNA(Pro) deacylase